MHPYRGMTLLYPNGNARSRTARVLHASTWTARSHISKGPQLLPGTLQEFPTILPDLPEVQRIRFCWFLTEGLTEELTNCPSIFNIRSGIELVIYGRI